MVFRRLRRLVRRPRRRFPRRSRRRLWRSKRRFRRGGRRRFGRRRFGRRFRRIMRRSLNTVQYKDNSTVLMSAPASGTGLRWTMSVLDWRDVASGSGLQDRSKWLVKFLQTKYRVYVYGTVEGVRINTSSTTDANGSIPFGDNADTNVQNFVRSVLVPKKVVQCYLLAWLGTTASGTTPTLNEVVTAFSDYYGPLWADYNSSLNGVYARDTAPRTAPLHKRYRRQFKLLQKFHIVERSGSVQVHSCGPQTAQIIRSWRMHPGYHFRRSLRRMPMQSYSATGAADKELPLQLIWLCHWPYYSDDGLLADYCVNAYPDSQTVSYLTHRIESRSYYVTT